MLLIKFTLSALILKKQTTFCGPSNLEAQEEDFLKKDIHSKDEEIGEIDKIWSMT